MMQNNQATQQITPEEQKQVVQIVKSYFMQQTNNSVEKTNKLLEQLAKAIQGPGVKLVHLGNNVFVVQVTGPNTAEIDNLSKASANRKLAELIDVLRNLGVKQATYSTKEKISRVLDQASVTYNKKSGRNGETVYTLELQ